MQNRQTFPVERLGGTVASLRVFYRSQPVQCNRRGLAITKFPRDREDLLELRSGSGKIAQLVADDPQIA